MAYCLNPDKTRITGEKDTPLFLPPFSCQYEPDECAVVRELVVLLITLERHPFLPLPQTYPVRYTEPTSGFNALEFFLICWARDAESMHSWFLSFRRVLYAVCFLLGNYVVCFLLCNYVVCFLLCNYVVCFLLGIYVVCFLLGNYLVCFLLGKDVVCFILGNYVVCFLLGNNVVCFLLGNYVVCFLLGNSPASPFFIHVPMKMEPIEGSETSAFRTQTPGNYPKENILHN